ncbi:MAG TPA: hypothetical protein P5084_13460, partial [Paludibacter sp.]|nr:hypothetical protein [Paludibacter sp.]
MKKSLLLLFLFCITGLLSGVVLSITPFQTASTFVSKINSSTTESYPVPVFSAVATQCQAGGELGLAIDGSMATMYHSDWGGKSLPDTLDFTFMDVPRIDSVIYYPRKVGTSANGDFGNTEIRVANKTNPNAFIKLMDKDF